MNSIQTTSAAANTHNHSFSQARLAPQYQQHVNRKPLPPRSAERTVIQPLTPIQQRHPSHTHNRTSSSGALSPSSSPQLTQSYPPNPHPNNMYQPNYSYPQQSQSGTRRTLSNATSSTSSTNGGPSTRKNSAGASTLHRTVSNRSGSTANSYVASLRKQKATVWSDRAQHEDPRLVAKQREAKMKAARDLSTGAYTTASRVSTSGNSSITGGMRAKIRHHGAPKAQQYNPKPSAASGVPMRLSAREVDDDDSEDDRLAVRPFHNRTGSGRSSLGSNGRASSIYGPGGPGVITRGSSEGNTPPQLRTTNPSVEQQRQRAGTQNSTGAEPTPVPGDFRGPDYFSLQGQTKSTSPGSTNSEQESEFGKVGALPHRVRGVKEEEERNEDLARRGSVDERTTTLRGYGRLFVANPDVDD